MKITDSMQCDIWYQALLERAVEYTGVFFVGVKTTGVFCISVCRARKPRRENVQAAQLPMSLSIAVTSP